MVMGGMKALIAAILPCFFPPHLKIYVGEAAGCHTALSAIGVRDAFGLPHSLSLLLLMQKNIPTVLPGYFVSEGMFVISQVFPLRRYLVFSVCGVACRKR